MKAAYLAASAAVLLATALPGMAAPAPPPAPAPAPAPQAPPPISFAQIKAAADKAWDRMDANHDGKIDSADRDVRLLERFAKWDTNHDGVISKDEFLAFVHARRAQWRGHHPAGGEGAPPPPPPPSMPLPPPPGSEHGHGMGYDGPPPPGGPGAGWAHRGPGWHPGGIVAMALIGAALHDAHKDGVVTRAAFDAAIKARFDAIDTNHDGTLTHDELRAAMRGWHHGHRWRMREWHHRMHRPGHMPPPPPKPQPPVQ